MQFAYKAILLFTMPVGEKFKCFIYMLCYKINGPYIFY